jgi:hypothetical protein
MMAIHEAKRHGLAFDAKLAQAHVDEVRRILAAKRQRLLLGMGTPDVLDVGYFLAALEAAEKPRDDTIDALVHFLTLMQLPDGRWQPTLFRPPMNDSDFTATTLSMRGLQQFGPPGRSGEMARRIGRARQWLTTATPRTTEDKAFQLLGLSWAGLSSKDIHRSSARLLAEQRADGGWAQRAAMASDAYATGLVLVALRQSGAITVPSPVYQRGVRFLLETQQCDGSWYVESRSLPVQPYFESGFPHGRSQFISCAATSWASMALAPAAKAP